MTEMKGKGKEIASMLAHIHAAIKKHEHASEERTHVFGSFFE